MTPSLEGLPTKAKEAPSPHEARLTLLDTNPVFQYLGEIARCMTFPEAVIRRCSVKKVFLKLCRIHRKTSLWESLFNKVAGLQI